ncbi:MAG: RNA polymerase sigma-70 factor (ECF subfamily) [Candidatus Pelagisphaera sp.]|jgi:RNA polymerase sigma-70 factor (ECF subfamily)
MSKDSKHPLMPKKESSDPYEHFVELFTQNEQTLRTFVRSLVPTWHDTDEIVQEVALVAWQKFEQFERGTSFLKWTCVIARFKALAYRRKFARERLAFNEALMDVMADESVKEAEQRKWEYDALEGCLQKLPEKQRKWVTLAHTPGTSSLEMAQEMGIKPGAFYMRLNRIRNTLQHCINNSLKDEGLA